MRRNNDRMLLESLVRKYGKNGVKNAIRRINENANSDFEIKDGVLVKYRGNGGKVVIPDNVTKIGWGAFAGCESLTSVTIPDSVTEIGRGAFDGCSRLASITIPDSVTKIVGATFRGCSSLKIVTIPDSVTLIGDYAFYGCKSLTSVTIPDSVTTIAGGAFEGCSSLVNIKIPNGVKIGKNAFKDTKINKNKNLINEMAYNKPYVTEDNVERIIGDLRNTYPEIHHTDIRAFFGGWQNGVWEFEPEWFDDIFTWEELIDAFDDWLDNEGY